MSDLWYKNAIIYGVDVAVFQDSNGDGIGDFQGLLRRLDYLADLGVTTLWLLPFYPSPRRDNGYDVTDYYAVHPTLGTLDDFIDVVHRAGEYGIRILLDLVMDHTSNEHPWFQAARRDPQSRFRQYYVWATSPPPVEPGKGNIFPDSESTVWTYDKVGAAYYYHRFYHFEPDLNAANPEVRDEIKRVMDFWLSFGVSGFRLDAASHMIESHGIEGTELDEPHAILKDLREGLTARRGDAVLLGEADEPPDKLADFFGDGDELHLLYNFLLDNYLFLALAQQRAEPIARALRLLPSVPECCQWVNFLRNLDELDLERLTDAEREDVYRAFAPEPGMRIFGRGIRRRLAPMLGSRPRLEMALSLLFSMPGAPMLIYGDEIGMGDDLSLEERNAVRTPMQWSPEGHAGFSTAKHDSLSRPVISKGPYSFTHVNVADQARDPGSLLNWFKSLIVARRHCPEWGWSEAEVLETGEPSVLAHRCHWKNEAVIAVHNLGDKSRSVKIHLAGMAGQLVRILGNASVEIHDDMFVLDLTPHSYGWYRIEQHGRSKAGGG